MTEGDITLSIGTDGAPKWSDSGYRGAGTSIDFTQGVANTTTSGLAFSNGQYLNIDLSSAGSEIDWTSLSVDVWRNGNGAPNQFQFAYDSTGDGWTTSDLIGASTEVAVTGTGGATAITTAAGLPTGFTSTETVRLYFWDTDGKAGANGNTHIYNVTADYVTAAIPEPSSFALIAGALGFASIMLRRRR